MEEKKECVREGGSNAQDQIVRGKEYQNPLTIVYHNKNGVSRTTDKKSHFYYGMGIKEKNCAYCGKNFVPTRPEYAWGECCSYTCSRRYDEILIDKATRRGVVMLHPETKNDIIKFDSTKDAAEFAKVDVRKIRDACNGLQETSGGYSWRWEDEPVCKPIEEKQGRYIRCTTVLSESMCDKVIQMARANGCTRSKMIQNIISEYLKKEKENENS